MKKITILIIIILISVSGIYLFSDKNNKNKNYQKINIQTEKAEDKVFYKEFYSTETYDIEIINYCKEGEVVCNDVKYIAVNKKNNKKIELNGSTYHKMNNDIPGKFLGYVFKNNEYEYYILVDSGELFILKNDKKIFVEKIIEK